MLAGAFKKDPQRLAARAMEPKPSGPIGDAPEWMDDSERVAWREVIDEAPPGVLTNADRGIVTIVAQLRKLVAQRMADTKDRALLKACYGELGMTPASRSKVQAKVPDNVKPMNEFAAV
jgi:phage terminase small subunit